MGTLSWLIFLSLLIYVCFLVHVWLNGCDAKTDNQQYLKNLFKKLHHEFSERDIEFFICDGTLLGAVRHKDMIPWDDDIDVAILREEFMNKRTDIDAALDAIGEPVHRDDGLIQVGGSKGHIDIFSLEMDHSGTGRIQYESAAMRGYFPNDYYDNIDVILPIRHDYVFGDMNGLPGPNKGEEQLERQYGPNWKIGKRDRTHSNYALEWIFWVFPKTCNYDGC